MSAPQHYISQIRNKILCRLRKALWVLTDIYTIKDTGYRKDKITFGALLLNLTGIVNHFKLDWNWNLFLLMATRADRCSRVVSVLSKIGPCTAESVGTEGEAGHQRAPVCKHS